MEPFDPTLAPLPLGSIPVFPLPNTVLFPDQRLALHIFEPRYRQMVRDVLEASAPYLVLARMQDVRAPEPVPFARVATAGRVVAHQRLPDGRYNILVEGAVRVALEEVGSDRLYRCVRCTPLPEPRDADADVDGAAHTALLSLAAQVIHVARARAPHLAAFDPPADLPPARLAWRVADRLVADPTWRQRILEADRARERVAHATAALAETLSEVASHGGGRGGGAN
jgi:ATP-dependent Lon protease